MAGIVCSAGVFAEVGGVLHRLPAARTPLGEHVAALIAAMDAGAVQPPCATCNRFDCECNEPDADPHGDLSEWQDCELPY